MIPNLPKQSKHAEPDASQRTRRVAKEIALLAAEENREALTVALAARLLGKSRDTIYRWLGEGRLAGRKVGGCWLVYKDAVEAEWKAGLVQREEEPR